MYRRILFGLAAALAAAACASTPTATSQITPGASFAGDKTFAFADPTLRPDISPAAYAEVRQEVTDSLESKGYVPSSSSPADMTVAISLDRLSDATAYGSVYGGSPTYQYTEGKETIDVYNSSTRQQLWHGEASQSLDPNKPSLGLIDVAVTDVMAGFPARA
jgi:hypothetical protein